MKELNMLKSEVEVRNECLKTFNIRDSTQAESSKHGEMASQQAETISQQAKLITNLEKKVKDLKKGLGVMSQVTLF